MKVLPGKFISQASFKLVDKLFKSLPVRNLLHSWSSAFPPTTQCSFWNWKARPPNSSDHLSCL